GPRDRPGRARLSGVGAPPAVGSGRGPVPQVTLRRMVLAGFNIGSSAVKAAAYDSDGALLAQAAEAVPSLHPGPGRSEGDGDGVWKAGGPGVWGGRGGRGAEAGGGVPPAGPPPGAAPPPPPRRAGGLRVGAGRLPGA